ncbi:WecB/TagA/CpsF family glycosyltransferase [Leptolyngbya sp. 15MV]|nr:WecB/TagA/CpsF family glycosyltransferase [Leptolyngbya sp. 15MV]
MTSHTNDTRAFLGVDFAPLTLADAHRWIVDAIGGDRFRYLVTPNVDHLVMLHTDRGEAWRVGYRKAVREADLIINDSRVLARLARLSGLVLPVTPGSDLTRELVAGGLPPDTTVALIGGSEAETAWLQAALPHARILHHLPPMGVRDRADLHEAIARFVEDAGAQLTLFAIGAPQSELVAHTIARRGRARGVALCIGASVEFLSGAQRRAPRWMQRSGTEWAFRLLSEPRRLWRRYLVEGPRIFAIWWRWRGQDRGVTFPPP